jgi:hypothetical protein
MKTALELDDALCDVSLLLQEQRYDEALSILGDLMEKHPADRETHMYRLLVARILVLRHSLTPTDAAESLPTTANSPAPARGFRRLARSLLRLHGQSQTPPTDRLSQLQSSLAASVREGEELRTKEKKLLAEISSLSSKLLTSETTVTELQAMQNGVQFENRQLHASNLELRETIANLEAQLERSQSQLSEWARQAQEIGARDSKLQTEVVKLSDLLEVREKTIAGLETEQQRSLDTRSQNQKLHGDNQRLHQEILSLRDQLRSVESRFDEPARRYEQLADDYARLHIELEESQRKAGEAAALRQQLAGVESGEMTFREQQHKLEAQVAKLQQELSSREEKIGELDATRRRLRKAESLCQELGEETRRLKNEVLRRRERLGESVENQSVVNTPHQQLAERQSGTDLTPAGSAQIVPIAPAEETKPAAWRSRRGRSRWETIPATAVIVITAAIALGLLNTTSRKVTTPKEPPVVLQTVATEKPVIRADFEPRADFESTTQPPPQSATALAKTAVPKQKPGVKPTSRVHGMFRITRETELFNGPSENAALISSIRPGMKINVVDSRNGWLEIRSQHGRPSGFIRQDAAVRADEN